jgi:hypothetical protein
MQKHRPSETPRRSLGRGLRGGCGAIVLAIVALGVSLALAGAQTLPRVVFTPGLSFTPHVQGD